MLQYHFHMETLLEVPPQAFTPPPKVNSAIVRLIPKLPHERPECSPVALSRVVAQAFSQRRKMLRSTLKGNLPAEAWDTLGIDPQRRAETLTLEEFCQLSKVFTDPRDFPENS